MDQPGGGVPQPEDIAERIRNRPEITQLYLQTTALEYRERAIRDGIPFRPHGCFPPNDPLLMKIASTPGCHPFEKHLAGDTSRYSQLDKGGWATGDTAAENGMDLRLFYKEKEAGQETGTIYGAVRLGDRAAIGNGFNTTAHGGCIETILDETTAELVKCEFSCFMATAEMTVRIKKPVPIHTSLLVEANVKQVLGKYKWVIYGCIKNPENGQELASCDATCVDLTPFHK